MTKKELLEALTQAGVSRLEVQYDGFGDEGCIDWLDCYGPNGDKKDISDELQIALEGVLFELLCGERRGWEVNEGSSGLVELDVATGVAKFNHSWRETREDDFEASLQEGE